MNSTIKNINDDYWVTVNNTGDQFLIFLGGSSSKYNPVNAKLALEKIERVLEVFDSQIQFIYDKTNELYILGIDQITLAYIEDWSKKFNIPMDFKIQLTERSNWSLKEPKPLTSETNNTTKIEPPSLLSFKL